MPKTTAEDWDGRTVTLTEVAGEITTHAGQGDPVTIEKNTGDEKFTVTIGTGASQLVEEDWEYDSDSGALTVVRSLPEDKEFRGTMHRQDVDSPPYLYCSVRVVDNPGTGTWGGTGD